MNKKFLRLMTILFLALTVALALGSCSSGKKGDGKDTETQDPAANNNIVTLDPDSALPYADYRIIRADKASKSVKESAAMLRDKIKELSGVTAKLGSDFDGAVDKEILVGNTKRLSDDTLLLGHFKIVREGNKIAILGGSDEAIMDGVNYFIDNCLSDKGYLCGEGYAYFGGKTYSVTKIEVNGKTFTDVYLKNEIDNKTLCEELVAAIAENVGLKSNISNDVSKINMVFTNDAKAFGVGDDEWGINVKDGTLYIVAPDTYTQMSAYNYLISILSDTKGALKFTDGENKREKLETKEEFYEKDQLVIYKELPSEIRRNYEYQVSVTQGNKTHSIPVYDHTMEYIPGRGIGGDYHRRFSQFAFSGAQVRVDIKVGVDFSTYTVFPSAKQFKSEFKDGVISVFLDKPDYFGVRLDDDDNTILSVFADLPEYYLDIPAKDAENVIYVDGWMDTEEGFLDITEPETTLYIAPGAVLNARVKVFSSAPNSKIIGRGVILDPFEDIYNYDIRVGGTEGDPRKLCVVSGSDSLFDGPVLMDARCFNLATGGTGVTVRNYKALSTMMTTDGITANSKNSTYEHCWIYCGDNGLVISWTQDQVYRDITMGTTCAAVYPQGSTNNIEIDGLYVFRANDGILNHRYNNPYDKDTTASVTLRNLDCIDATSFSRLFGGRNMGTLDEKFFNFINVNLPTITGTTSVHTSNSTDDINRLIQMENPVYRFTENYTLSFTNLYIEGEAITSESQVKIVNEWNNEFLFDNDGKYTPVKRNANRVNYTAPGKVMIGEHQVTFKDNVVSDGDDLLVPADDLIKAVRAKNTAATVEKNGVKYIKSSDIKALDTVASAKVENGSLYITLKAPKGNLILDDEGKISQIAEATCYTVELVAEDDDGDHIYSCYPHGDSGIGGVSVAITDEIRMYGAGTYTVSFQAKASNTSNIRYGWSNDNAEKFTNNYMTAPIGEIWEDYEFTIDVTEEMLYGDELFAIRINATSADKMEYFSFRFLELTKD